MSNHWDYGPDKTKSERRERQEQKIRERMLQGKKAKLLHQIIMDEAKKAQEEYEARKEARTASKA